MGKEEMFKFINNNIKMSTLANKFLQENDFLLELFPDLIKALHKYFPNYKYYGEILDDPDSNWIQLEIRVYDISKYNELGVQETFERYNKWFSEYWLPNMYKFKSELYINI